MQYVCIFKYIYIYIMQVYVIYIYILSDVRLKVTRTCETGAHADECFVSVWTATEN